MDYEMSKTFKVVAPVAAAAWLGLCILNYFAGVALVILVIVEMFT